MVHMAELFLCHLDIVQQLPSIFYSSLSFTDLAILYCEVAL